MQVVGTEHPLRQSLRGVGGDRFGHDAGHQAGPPGLGAQHVRAVLGKQQVARLGMGLDRHQVAHRAGGQEQRGLLAEQRGHPLAERDDRGSSARCSSPTSARAIASRIAGVGRVSVSLFRRIRSSFMGSAPATVLVRVP
ncbi:MAG: hypothetical protein R3E68_11545 [Burkholderiaceae bacterium]